MFSNFKLPTCRRGIIIYVKDGFNADVEEELTKYGFSESVWITVKLQASDVAGAPTQHNTIQRVCCSY